MHPIGEHQALADDAAAITNLLDLGVQPQIRVAALQRPVPERVDPLVERGLTGTCSWSSPTRTPA